MKLYRRRKINLILSLLLSFIIYSSNAQTNPGLSFGGSFDDKGLAMCLSGDGGYMLAGSTRSFGEGSEDYFVIKLSAHWQHIWSETYGGVHQDHPRSIIPTDEGFIIFGDVWDFGDARLGMYLSLIDTTGNKLWGIHYGTQVDDWGFKVIEALNGDFMLLGYTRGFEISGDIYLFRTDHQGNVLWENTYGYNRDDYGMDIIENDDGSFTIIGSKNGFFNDVHTNYTVHDADILLVKIDADGNELWKKTIGDTGHDFGYSIKKAPAGGNYIFGSSQSYGAGSFDMFLAKTDGEGNEEWHKTYGGALYDYGLSMDINENGNLFLLGTTRSFGQNNSEDFYLVKVDEQGNNIWDLTIGGELADFGNSVIAMPDSGCVVMGSSKSFSSGGYDILFIKIDKFGQIENITVEINNGYENQVVIAPNPMHNTGRVQLADNNSNVSMIMEINSINGSVLKKYKLDYYNSSFDVSGLPAGVYIYNINYINSTSPAYRGKLIVY